MTEIEIMEPQSSAAAYQRTIKKKLKPGAIHNRRPGNRPLTVCFWTAFMSRVVTFLRRCAWSLLLVLPSLIAAGNTAGGCRVHADIGQSLALTPMACKMAITGTFCSCVLDRDAGLEYQRYLAAAVFVSTFAVLATTTLVFWLVGAKHFVI